MAWTTWSCYTPTATVNDTAAKLGRNWTASRERRFEGLSRMRRKAHVRFLGGGKSAMASCYPTHRRARRAKVGGRIGAAPAAPTHGTAPRRDARPRPAP